MRAPGADVEASTGTKSGGGRGPSRVGDETMFDLTGKRGLIVGVANEKSIAYGCAQAMRAAGAELAITYLNAKAEPYVRPLAEGLDADVIAPLDVTKEHELDALFEALAQRWGRLDFLVHSIAFAPREDLHGRVLDCTREGFSLAMTVSCHSFIDMARRAEPLMTEGGALLCLSFFGAVQVVPHYGIMGPVKAALESAAKYLAYELGPKGVRVHALSPGPIHTRAASGIAEFDDLVEAVLDETPTGRLVTIEDCGAFAAFLVSDEARNLNGGVHYIDGGHHIVD